MIYLTFTVDNLSTVQLVYDQIQAQSSDSATGTFTTVTGTGFPVDISTGTSPFTASDSNGTGSTWYMSRYYCSSKCSVPGEGSSWSDPILGEVGEICYDPTYPVEEAYGTSEQLIIDRIRRLIGDPVGLKHEYNEQDNISECGKIYEFGEGCGWPCSININGTTYTSTSNPTVNNYRYLKFTFGAEDDDLTTVSGLDVHIDIFYYVFRHSDREIYEAYSTAYPPAPLTIATATSEVYMLQSAITLLSQELIEDSVESGATITDEASRWSPDPGLRTREAMVDKLQKRLDNVVKVLSLGNISGVLLD